MNASNRLCRNGLTLLSCLAFCGLSNANPIAFDPTGLGGSQGSLKIDLIDQAPGNEIAVGVDAASTNTALTRYDQANLQSLSLDGVPVFSQGDGGNHFTFVSGYGAVLTANVPVSGGNVIVFAFDATNPTNFYRMYATGPTQGDNLTGTGFVPTSGLILSGHFIASGFSSAFVLGNTSSIPLDSFNANDYPAIESVVGSGGTAITLVIDAFDADYFPDLIVGATTSFSNASEVLPFREVDPSARFTAMDGSTFVGAASVGTVNGFGANTMFQIDANQSFVAETATPKDPIHVAEPRSIALVAVSLLAALVPTRRRRRHPIAEGAASFANCSSTVA